MIRKKGSFSIKEKKVKFSRFKKEVPRLLANESRNHFLEGFRRGGGQTDRSRGGWKPRKSRRQPSRAILVLSGALRRDISVLFSQWSKIVVGSINLPYARRHNEGLAGMPQREFIGESRSLKKKHIKIILRNLIRL
jgi:hypothetical protein